MKVILATFVGLSLVANLVTAAQDSNADAENPSPFERDLLKSRIVGGTEASQGEFPAFVEWDGCGASLVWKDIILSAAHCNSIKTNTVLVGAYQDQSTQGGAQFRTIKARSVHPSYNSRTMNYDYLVMKLDSPVSVTPVVLNANPSYPANNEVLTVIGFGATTNDDNSGATTLMKVNVNYIDTATCSNQVRDKLDQNLELCAGVSGGGKDSCFGDSGGPIFGSNGAQVGVVSYSYGDCAQAGSPGIYSRVSGAIGWINQQICALSSNPPASCQGGNPAPVKPSSAPVKLTRKPTPRPVRSPTWRPRSRAAAPH